MCSQRAVDSVDAKASGRPDERARSANEAARDARAGVDAGKALDVPSAAIAFVNGCRAERMTLISAMRGLL